MQKLVLPSSIFETNFSILIIYANESERIVFPFVDIRWTVTISIGNNDCDESKPCHVCLLATNRSNDQNDLRHWAIGKVFLVSSVIDTCKAVRCKARETEANSSCKCYQDRMIDSYKSRNISTLTNARDIFYISIHSSIASLIYAFNKSINISPVERNIRSRIVIF